MAYTDNGDYRLPQTDLEVLTDAVHNEVEYLRWMIELPTQRIDIVNVTTVYYALCNKVFQLRQFVHQRDQTPTTPTPSTAEELT